MSSPTSTTSSRNNSKEFADIFGHIDSPDFNRDISRLFAKTPYAKYLVVGHEESSTKEPSTKDEPKVSVLSYSCSLASTTDPLKCAELCLRAKVC